MQECQVVFGVTGPVKVLATWEGVSVLRGHDSVWITCARDFEPDCFDEAVRLLGLTGRDDYEIVYDPGTGSETYIFDGQSSEAPVRTLRRADDPDVLPGLPVSGP